MTRVSVLPSLQTNSRQLLKNQLHCTCKCHQLVSQLGLIGFVSSNSFHSIVCVWQIWCVTILALALIISCLQCFVTVGWSSEREWWRVGMVVCLEQHAHDLHMTCYSWCHFHPIIYRTIKIQNDLPFWCRLTQIPLNECCCCLIMPLLIVVLRGCPSLLQTTTTASILMANLGKPGFVGSSMALVAVFAGKHWLI